MNFVLYIHSRGGGVSTYTSLKNSVQIFVAYYLTTEYGYGIIKNRIRSAMFKIKYQFLVSGENVDNLSLSLWGNPGPSFTLYF